MAQPTPTLIYVHGFNSSEQSHKGVTLKRFVEQHHPELRVLLPRLPSAPQPAWLFLCDFIREHAQQPIALFGSSLGGFFSAALSEQFQIPAVLINPAAHPYRLLQDFLGWQQNPYTGERYQVLPEHMQQLQQLAPQRHYPELLQIWLEQADEVLDYREAVDLFCHSEQFIRPAGDHSYQNYDVDLPKMLQFALHKACYPVVPEAL